MRTPHLEVLHLAAHSLASFPEHFLSYAPRLVELRLRVPLLQAFPSSFLGHVPRLETLELETTYDSPSPYAEKLPIRSLPANFLINAPRLRHLALEPLGHVNFPQGFLSGSPQLRYLNLDVRSMPALPQGFLSRSPHLMNLKLDLKQVEALPDGFLAETPRLWNLEIDVHGVETLPAGFLVNTPHLTNLYLRAHSLTDWPADFLAHAPRIRTLSLAMPLLEPTLTPDHRLWGTLQTTSQRVKVIRPDPVYFDYVNATHPECRGTTIQFGDILAVWERAPDDHGHTLLTVPWREHELFASDWGNYCSYLIDSRFTAPTLEVCAADRAPEECDPVREPYDPEWGRG